LQNQEINQIRDKLEIAEESNADQISEFAKKVHIQFTFFNASASFVISKNLCRLRVGICLLSQFFLPIFSRQWPPVC